MPFRTDLAIEAAQSHMGKLPPGVVQKEYATGQLTINTVEISSAEGARLVGKPAGSYTTITSPPLHSSAVLDEEEIDAIASRIRDMLPREGLVLVVGLGNNDITPDAIGPRCIHQILATRHISKELSEQSGLGVLRPAAAIAPGVLGQTGIETSEIIRSIVDDIHPAAVIVVDALAARSASRLGNTIQISSTGISPGSGVMNRRKELSQDTLGVPVVSIGVPTVVDANTLASDLLDCNEEDEEKCRELFEPRGEALMITPREIDLLISHACKTLALAINKALHPQMTMEDIGFLTS